MILCLVYGVLCFLLFFMRFYILFMLLLMLFIVFDNQRKNKFPSVSHTFCQTSTQPLSFFMLFTKKTCNSSGCSCFFLLCKKKHAVLSVIAYLFKTSIRSLRFRLLLATNKFSYWFLLNSNQKLKKVRRSCPDHFLIYSLLNYY